MSWRLYRNNRWSLISRLHLPNPHWPGGLSRLRRHDNTHMQLWETISCFCKANLYCIYIHGSVFKHSTNDSLNGPYQYTTGTGGRGCQTRGSFIEWHQALLHSSLFLGRGGKLVGVVCTCKWKHLQNMLLLLLIHFLLKPQMLLDRRWFIYKICVSIYWEFGPINIRMMQTLHMHAHVSPIQTHIVQSDKQHNGDLFKI